MIYKNTKGNETKKTTFLMHWNLQCFHFLCAGGINTNTPRTSLDITAKNTDGSTSEGLIAPRLSGDQIKSADLLYDNAQTGAVVYATSAVTSPSPKTGGIIGSGYYYFDGTVWQKFIMAASTGIPFIPYVVAAGRASKTMNIIDGALPGGGYQKATFTVVTVNDGRWNTTNNQYTIGSGQSGYYLISLQGIETPNNANNSFEWNVAINGITPRFNLRQLNGVANSARYNSGGSVTLRLNTGDIIELGFTPCSFCSNGSGGRTSYTITTRAFSITYLGS